MQQLTLKPHYKAVRNYYKEIKQHTQQLSLIHEGNVAPHFANLLRYCAGRMGWTLAEQHTIPRRGRRDLRADGVLLDEFKLRHGVWEAKDSDDDLAIEVKKKFADGYPQDNILFQAPDRAILVQDGRVVADEDIGDPETLVDVLKLFFEYQPPAFEQWERAVAEFKEKVPELARSLLALIRDEKGRNKAFVQAFDDFTELVRQAINPNISERAMEEMLIQHLLTERIFRTVFNNPDFAQRNVIAREIEKVINALTSRHFSRHEFLRQLDRFYGALESTAATIDDYSEKQAFLNTVYEQFFQGFSVKVADTHGIVYTPQPIVDFMVRSVDDILKREFGKAEGLASEGVAILDPFVGTGNFILRVMRQMPKSKLPHKYRHELFCNEVMLLPYYIASMNIEHEYVELAGRYEPFEGISLVDTFELAEGKQLPLFVKENTQRVQRQKNAPIFVIIGNPPYNVGQLHENDNNKNRKYEVVDRRVADTYAEDSRATLKSQLSDPYIKAIRWASDRIGKEGIVAFVTNNSFINGVALDGVRKHLAQDFNLVYILDLGGNVRKNPKLSGTTHNVFGIQVGVSINLLIRTHRSSNQPAKIFYTRVGETWRKEEKYDFLEDKRLWTSIEWSELNPSKRHVWLTDDLGAGFEQFIPIGSSEAKSSSSFDVETIFKLYGTGTATGRDAWASNFNAERLTENTQRMLETYNIQAMKWGNQPGAGKKVDEFVLYDDSRISWSSTLKAKLNSGRLARFDKRNIRSALYRPFTKVNLYFDEFLVDRGSQFPKIFPILQTEVENRIICLSSRGSEKPFMVLISREIADWHVVGAGSSAQCFPFYTYDEDGRNRRENITDWALEQFRTVYAQSPASEGTSANPQSPISKWDIFHYIYALLHHPNYRQTYAANLRRELPRIPFVRDFWGFVRAGERLAEIHVHYEEQPEYPLQHIEDPELPLDYRVEKMRLSRDKRKLKYNDFLTLAGIPPEVYEYRLGNRSALEWVIDQYQVKTDKRSGITNDPNRPEDETYILRLVKQVITASLETETIVEGLPGLEIRD